MCIFVTNFPSNRRELVVYLEVREIVKTTFAVLSVAIVAAAPAVRSALHQSAAELRSTSDDRAGSARRPVLVELFTSEGCSSCPPADALLARLDEQQPIAGADIIALEEHVNYWDRLGWVDPFSGAQWTDRQQDYAAARHDQGVYTPQMVVNGRTEFVGSREGQARQAIAQAALQAQTEVAISNRDANKAAEGQFKVTVSKLMSPQNKDSAEVFLAITETGLHSAVRAGENSGVDVHHSAVVRCLRKIGSADPGKDPAFSGEATIKFDKNWKRENLRTVAFVQEKRSHQVLGAATARIEP
jgi:hypothetical protein